MSTLNKEKNLSKRIDVALAKKDYKKTFKDTDSLNIYYRVGTELLAGLLIGAGLGWTIDQWFNTTPLFLLVFFLLGGNKNLRAQLFYIFSNNLFVFSTFVIWI